MLAGASKAFFFLLSQSTTLKRAASRYGMRKPNGFACRFIAGESVEDAVESARAIEAQGLMQTLDFLGESVTSLATAEAATRSRAATSSS